MDGDLGDEDVDGDLGDEDGDAFIVAPSVGFWCFISKSQSDGDENAG